MNPNRLDPYKIGDRVRVDRVNWSVPIEGTISNITGPAPRYKTLWLEPFEGGTLETPYQVSLDEGTFVYKLSPSLEVFMTEFDKRLHNNDEIVTNEQGGKQSKLEYAFELIEPEFSKRMAHVLYTGMQKYGARNWQNIPVDVHIGRAMYHLTQALEGLDQSEDHYANAACRVMFAMLTAKNVPYPTGKI